MVWNLRVASADKQQKLRGPLREQLRQLEGEMGGLQD